MKKKVVNSPVFGQIEYTENDLVEFKKPILGFEECLKYLHIVKEENLPFSWFQAVDDSNILFMVTDPFFFFKDYEIKISDSESQSLQLKNPEDGLIFTIVSIPSDPKKITTNLKAPIVVNIKNKYAGQFVLNNDKYMTKTPILKEENNAGV